MSIRRDATVQVVASRSSSTDLQKEARPGQIVGERLGLISAVGHLKRNGAVVGGRGGG